MSNTPRRAFPKVKRTLESPMGDCYQCREEFYSVDEAREHHENFGRGHGMMPAKKPAKPNMYHKQMNKKRTYRLYDPAFINVPGGQARARGDWKPPETNFRKAKDNKRPGQRRTNN